MRVVILAAGQGKRMKADVPKVLVKMKGKPMLEYLVESVINSGVDNSPIVVVSSDNQNLIKKALGKYNCQYALQKEQLGTGHALACARELINDNNDFVISFYGDHPFVKSKTVKELSRNCCKTITMMTIELPDFEDWRVGFYNWGRVIRSEGQVKAIIEFKDADDETKKVTEVNPGFYCFENRWLWDNIDKLKNENAQKEYYITDLVKIAFEQGLEIGTFPISPEEGVGVNTKEELERAENLYGN